MSIDEYVEYMRLCDDLSAGQIRRKEKFLRYWFEDLNMSLDAPYTEIKMQLLAVCSSLSKKGYNDRVSYLNGYYTFLINTQKFKGVNPMIFVKRVKHKRKVRPWFTSDQILQIINCPVQGKQLYQDGETYSLLIKAYAITGCRCSELLDLKIKDFIIGDQPSIILRETKNGDDVVLPIPKGLAIEIDDLIKKRGFKIYVFENRYGRRIAPCRIEEEFKKRLIYLGLREEGEKGVNLHTLRHSKATRLADNGVTPYDLASLLNHSSIETSMNYVHTSPGRKANQSLLDPIYKRFD